MSYRYPNERLILALTLVAVFLVIAVTATATLCGSALFVLAMLALGYALNRRHHAALMKVARPVTAQTLPRLAALVGECQARLKPGRTQAFVAPAACSTPTPSGW